MSARNASLHVGATGTGPALVLLHGWAMHGGVFGALVAQLCDRFTVYSVDLPGHGRSRDSTVPLTLDASAEAILAQVPDTAAWCGWSLGGLVALHAAASRPARIPRLALICASPRFARDDQGDSSGWRYGVSPEILQDFASGLRRDYRGTLERFVALEAFGSDHEKVEIRALRDALFARGEPAAHVLADGLALLETTDLRASLPGLRMPSLWLGGRRDKLVDSRAMQLAAASAPRAQFHCFEHAGHAPFLTHAADVAAVLTDFLQA
jgi:pimeloyl-[acyl-carrier protein] methyl ester esterase